MFDGIDIKLYQEEIWDFTINDSVNNMDISCLNTIIFDKLAINFDIGFNQSYNNNTAHTITSTTFYENYKLSNLNLKDYGLTQYDVGRASYLSGSTNISRNNKLLTLLPVKYNNESGDTFNYGEITKISSSTIGNYFQLSGGYLSNFFKLEGFEYELLPARYNEGYTLETWVNLTSDSFIKNTGVNDNFLLFVGTRSENKYSVFFSGETGYTTSSGQTLGSDNTSGDIVNYEQSLENSVIAIKLNNDYTLSVRSIDSSNSIKEYKSNKIITNTGWTMINMVYEPYNVMDDEELLECKPVRLGDLSIYINGLNYMKINDVEEAWFKGLDTQNDKQIGVPYNINWGGGSFGLKHSYHYDPFWQEIRDNLIKSGDNGSFSSSLSGLTSNYDLYIDNINTYSGNTLLITGSTLISNDLLSFNENLVLEPKKRYSLTLDIKENDLFVTTGGNLSISLNGDTTGVTVLSSTTYSGVIKNKWEKLTISFETNEMISNNDIINFKLIVNDIESVIDDFKINVDNLVLYKSNYIENVYSKDSRKKDLLIEEQFDGNFIGAIQILRFYLKPLKIHEIRHNFNIIKNRYGLKNNFGGRKIYI